MLMVMTRGRLVVVAVLATLLVSGCSAAGKRVDKNTANISILSNRTNNLKSDMGGLRTQVDRLVIQVTGLNEKLDSVAERRRKAPEPVPAVSDADRKEAKADREVMLLEQELSLVERRLENLERSKKPTVTNIKVLASTTDLQPAKDMAAYLGRNGFPVKAVDFASSSGYNYDTVYYAEGYETQAQRIAEVIGGRTVIKPLTWKSVFDVIAVKGDGQRKD